MRYLILFIVVAFCSSCASIFSKKVYQVPFSSAPSSVKLTIIDNNKRTQTDANSIVYTGKTPTTVALNASAGFFKKASYEITFELEGSQSIKMPLEAKIDGWYFGNLLLGGVIGMLIVDPATGKMFALQQDPIHANFDKSTANKSLEIRSIQELSQLERQQVIALK